MPTTVVSETAIADALVAVAWMALAFDAVRRARLEAPARAALGPVVGGGWRPSRAVQGVVLAAAFGAAAVLEVVSGRLGGSRTGTAIGLGLVATGLAVHLRARATLGALWSGTIVVHARHRLVTEGPYGVVRHPIYLAVLLLAAGSLLAHPSVATACVAIGVTAGLALKIHFEERVLQQTLGAPYAEYAARVPALFPEIRSRRCEAGLHRLGRWMTPARRHYALLLGATLWGGWLVSLVAGPGLFDLAGQVKGTDFLEFYAAGKIVLQGSAARLYDLHFQQEIEHALTAPQQWQGLHGFLNPPFFALVFVPFALLPYLAAFALWSVVGIGLVATSLALVGRALPAWRRTWPHALGWALAFVPVFAAVSYGQNSLLSLALFTAVFVLLQRGNDLAAGAALGGLLYKPQLVVVLAALLLFERRWRTLVGLAMATVALAAVSCAVSVPGTLGWVELSRAFPTMLTTPGFPIWNMHSLYSFFTLLLPSDAAVARLLTLVASVVVLAQVRRLQPSYRRDTLPLWYATALWATALLSPHVFLYDLSPLVLAALLVWPARRDPDLWCGGLAVLWVTLVFSGPLTRALQTLIGPAIQVSVPVLAVVGATLLRSGTSSGKG